jgi:hypothetical protein
MRPSSRLAHLVSREIGGVRFEVIGSPLRD